MVELPDDLHDLQRIANQVWNACPGIPVTHNDLDVLLQVAYPLIAARVRAEAVAEHRADLQYRIEVSTRIENDRRVAEAERDEYHRNWREAEKRTAAAVAEAVVAERQRTADLIAGLVRPNAELNYNGTEDPVAAAYVEGIREAHAAVLAAGSVPVATPPELQAVSQAVPMRIGPTEMARLRACLTRPDRDDLTPWEVVECAADQLAAAASGPVATPTEPDEGDDEPLTYEEVVACLADARGEPDWTPPVPAKQAGPDWHDRDCGVGLAYPHPASAHLPVDEVICPNCDAHIRARMSDRPLTFGLAGIGEAAKILGVSKQRVQQLTDRSDFPVPVARLAASPVWLADDIRRYKESRRTTPGPVPTAEQPTTCEHKQSHRHEVEAAHPMDSYVCPGPAEQPGRDEFICPVVPDGECPALAAGEDCCVSPAEQPEER